MTLTLLQAVTLINDANMLAQTLTPLVAQAKAMGKDEITKEQLEEHAKQTGANIDDLFATIESLS